MGMVFVGKFVLILGKFGKFEIVAIENLVEFVRLSTNKKKFLAISFTTLQLYGGLNHIILTLLLFFYFVLEQNFSIICLDTLSGRFLVILGGWLDELTPMYKGSLSDLLLSLIVLR